MGLFKPAVWFLLSDWWVATFLHFFSSWFGFTRDAMKHHLFLQLMFSSSWHLSDHKGPSMSTLVLSLIQLTASKYVAMNEQWLVQKIGFLKVEKNACRAGGLTPVQYFRWVPAPTSDCNEEGCDHMTCCVSCFWASCCEHLQLLSGSFCLEAAVKRSGLRRGCNVIMIQRNHRQVLT